ncbi:MAG TPA: HNH endonuclease [Desulfobulbaceae bacterium]|nr:HNH endonuclease [Desulfobulbaceae bacterium]
MTEFREEPWNQECAWCGRRKKLEVHHIVPVSVAPWLAADKGNMLMLCRKPACHQVIGHNGDFGSRYVENVIEVCAAGSSQVVKTIRAGKSGG